MVAALHEYILEEVGNLLATEVLHELLVAGMVIETETCIVGKNAEPISIVLLIYTCLLQENLLHLLQVGSIYLLLYLCYTFSGFKPALAVMLMAALSSKSRSMPKVAPAW